MEVLRESCGARGGSVCCLSTSVSTHGGAIRRYGGASNQIDWSRIEWLSQISCFDVLSWWCSVVKR